MTQNQPALRKQDQGFTLIEILVAMIVLAAGLLGMAAMTVMVMRGSRGASDQTASTNICQLKLEELKDVSWDLLGNETTMGSVNAEAYGLALAGLAQKTGLNSQGKTRDEVCIENSLGAGCAANSTVDDLGPYKYIRTFVVCKGDAASYPESSSDTVQVPAANENPQSKDCSADPLNPSTTRPSSLGCTSDDITGTTGPGNTQKKLKVLCTWHSSDGQCHSVNLSTTAVKL